MGENLSVKKLEKRCVYITAFYLCFWSIHSFPRDTSQGPAFEKAIAPADLIISLECKPVIGHFSYKE